MTRSTKNGISNNYGGMSSPRGGGGVRKGISPYIVIIAMIIQFEVFYFYFGVQNKSFIKNETVAKNFKTKSQNSCCDFSIY